MNDVKSHIEVVKKSLKLNLHWIVFCAVLGLVNGVLTDYKLGQIYYSWLYPLLAGVILPIVVWGSYFLLRYFRIIK
jgi:hypothetical protein